VNAVNPGHGPYPEASWVERVAFLPDGRTHLMVVDAAATDPLTQSYLLSPETAANSYLVKVLLALTDPGDRVLDLGAFLGEFALAAATHGCEVVAVEANPALAAMLTASANLNRFSHLQVVNAAVGDRAGTVTFAPHGPWGQVRSGTNVSPSAGDVTVDRVAIDDLVASLGWESVDFVKLDVEGSEMNALAGAASLLSGPNAPSLLFESNIAPLMENGTEPRLLLEAVEAFGYSLHRVMPTEIVPCRSDDFQAETVADYIALKGKSLADVGLAAREPLKLSETAARILAEARHERVEHRQALAWQLQFARSELIDHPWVLQALWELRDDPELSVRAALEATPAVFRAEVEKRLSRHVPNQVGRPRTKGVLRRRLRRLVGRDR
jgi:FkbM family methyltransferase